MNLRPAPRSQVRRHARLAAAALALALCAVAAAQVPAAPSSTPTPPLLRLAGRLHPLVVHFPIALITTAGLFEALSLLRRRPAAATTGPSAPLSGPSRNALGCLVVGTIAAILAATTGWLNADLEPPRRAMLDTLQLHRWLGIGVTCLAVLTAALAGLGLRRNSVGLRRTYRAGLFLAVLGIGATGHLGGTMIYGPNYFWDVFRQAGSPPPTPPLRPASTSRSSNRAPVSYERDVAPIFAARCVECHGESRSKGGLRLTGLEFAMESEGVIVPGEPQESELLRRVALPPNDIDIMPPEGDPLTPEQVELLERWIRQMHPAPDAPRTRDTRTEEDDAGSGSDEQPAKPHSRAGAASRGTAASAPTPSNAKRDAALAALRARGASALPIAADDPAIDVNLGVLGKTCTDADLALLAGLETDLAQLNLADTSITDAGLESLKRFTGLQKLALQRTAITDAGLAHLATLTGLTTLNLYGTRVSDSGLRELAKLPTLARLFLWQTQVTEAGITDLCRARPALKIERGGQAERLLVTEAAAPDAAQPAAQPAAAAPSPAPAAAPASVATSARPRCCAEAEAAGKTCEHPCCVAAREKGEVCQKCLAK